MKRIRYILIAVILFFVLLGIQFIPRQPSERDLSAIKKIVGKRTSEAIMDIEVQPNGTIQVTTGWIDGPLSGDGHYFQLRKIFGIWWIYKSEHWAA